MARARNIKPGFFLNDDLAEIEPLGRLLFAGLWTIADREGRLEDRPKKIKAAALPYDNCNVDMLLQSLYDRGFIIRYEIDGHKYIAIANWHKHQNPHVKEAPSDIPAPPDKEEPSIILEPDILAPDENHASIVQEPSEYENDPADSLFLDSLNPFKDQHDDDNYAPMRDEQNDQNVPGDTKLIIVFEKEFGRPLSPMEIDQIREWETRHPPILVLEALKRAVLRGKYSFKYIGSILLEWGKNNLRTMQAIQTYDEDFQARRAAKNGQARAPAQARGKKKAFISGLYAKTAGGEMGPETEQERKKKEFIRSLYQ